MNRNDRRQALRQVVIAAQPIEEAISALSQFPWDSDETLVAVSRRDAIRVLRLYLDGVLSAEQCVKWANALEARDDVGFEQGREALLQRFVFELANPLLGVSLSPDAAGAWIDRLASTGRPNEPESP